MSQNELSVGELSVDELSVDQLSPHHQNSSCQSSNGGEGGTTTIGRDSGVSGYRLRVGELRGTEGGSILEEP